ncbi:LOW QUALITY PROTEIN: hypothetical protein T265_13437 [Opisthorchis viverrini]|uniref:Uncharacterized protein n=1 Tax=Opisthorchis viverrini TaxID=6198 RepID=A0A074ZTP5_OPIVI|nr:LOW QUALITY PROTEIN: hypothetical protein T265_13437 [Opisthorchis viverrini]KER29162.1 LOW QUALITY PROTEIN: hypothetical protein T265_13437 [Opisthorchis viverrini]
MRLEVAQWIKCGFTNRKVGDSNTASGSQLLLFRLGQHGSISALVLSSGRMAAGYWKDHPFGAQLPCHPREAQEAGYCQVAQAYTREVEMQRSGSNHGPSCQLTRALATEPPRLCIFIANIFVTFANLKAGPIADVTSERLEHVSTCSIEMVVHLHFPPYIGALWLGLALKTDNSVRLPSVFPVTSASRLVSMSPGISKLISKPRHPVYRAVFNIRNLKQA